MAREKSEMPTDDSRKRDFEVFFRESYSCLYYYALHLIPDPELCKDILGESYFYLWQHIPDFRPDTALTYMYTHVHNLCIDHIRRTKRQAAHTASYLHMLQEWNADERRESEQRIATIMELIARMPALTRTVMEKCYIEKKLYREVAQEVNLTESGVRKHVMKGLDIIRRFFSVKYKKRQ